MSVSRPFSQHLSRSLQSVFAAPRSFAGRKASTSYGQSIRTISSNATSNGRLCLQHQRSTAAFTYETSFARARRRFSVTATVAHGHLDTPKPGEELHVTFVDKEGDEHTFEVAKGDNLLDIAQANDVEMEGACGGSCACSTCHVIVEDQDVYDKIPEPDDDENDMLDLAFGLTETSRLGCQVHMTPEIDGLRVKLPNMTRNMQASDFSK